MTIEHLTPKKLFLIENDSKIYTNAIILLGFYGFAVDHHTDSHEAVRFLEESCKERTESPYDVYVLDGNTTPGNKKGEDGKMVYDWLEARGFEDRVVGFSSLPFGDVIGRYFPRERDVSFKNIGQLALVSQRVAKLI